MLPKPRPSFYRESRSLDRSPILKTLLRANERNLGRLPDPSQVRLSGYYEWVTLHIAIALVKDPVQRHAHRTITLGHFGPLRDESYGGVIDALGQAQITEVLRLRGWQLTRGDYDSLGAATLESLWREEIARDEDAKPMVVLSCLEGQDRALFLKAWRRMLAGLWDEEDREVALVEALGDAVKTMNSLVEEQEWERKKHFLAKLELMGNKEITK